MDMERNLRKTTFRLYPTPKQEVALQSLLRSHQQLYNAALEERIDCWRKTGKRLSYADQCKSLTVLRRELPEWAEAANCSSQQMTLRRLDKAFAAFFRRVKAGQAPGFPRFKSLQRFPGFSFKTHGDGWRFTPGADWRHGTLRLLGLGHLRARGQARQGGDVRASDVLHRDGKWYLSLTLDIGTPQRQRTSNAAMAFDWGVETFLTGVDHAGEDVRLDNPRWWQSEKDHIKELQQSVSRKRNKRSNRRRKAVQRLSRARAKTARRRLDWAHQQTAKLARHYALVATEELRIANMTRSAAGTMEEPGRGVAQKAGLNREILDTAPALFTSLLRCKVLETGGEWVEAPTRKLKPSQRCPACWALAIKSLSMRMHACAECGHTEPRDLASARVVLSWAMGTHHGQELAGIGTRERPYETPSSAQQRVE
ncbi:RNA-guided endonuclease InsQ/TnpB family protein [Azohydromonas lata]|uniref:Transposase n=1 Tax=Azohydromonas lata TaxID=45677 RepID=A0ABU5I7E6_9BURK|nr:transposase [Azohydromonas lata]MDZ5455007.1 transposase [Azohydromonas lata]